MITLSKFVEFYDRYNAVLPRAEQPVAKNLSKDIQKRKIVEFRNTVIGHIWDNKHSRPLLSSEINELLKTIFLLEDANPFIKWINDYKNNKYPNTVLSICEHLRNQIMENYGIAKEEIT